MTSRTISRDRAVLVTMVVLGSALAVVLALLGFCFWMASGTY